ncbi:MAG TPA: nodulation protein NfeD [Alphaproteobacteria bacterium]|nr:nodulation protein NfeD [Alphaproteobacteria bacterium]
MRRTCALLLAMAVLAGVPASMSAPVGADPAASVDVVDVKGAIGVATSRHIERALHRAGADGAVLVVIRLDTPGGLVSSTRDIIQSIVGSAVPVAVYVAPGGARAASAGTYITYAANFAAMAPGTNIGAATPISLGGPARPSSPPEPEQNPPARGKAPAAKDKADPDKAPPPKTTEERKVLNDAVAFIRSLAQMRGRNADWAERAVRDAATLTAQEALQQHVIDVVARDLPDLLSQLDGRSVRIGAVDRRLATKTASIVVIPTDTWTEVLSVITDPNIAYILMLAGIYGLAFEFMSPGMVLPGIVGGISLLLALAALSVLPVNYAGLALILLGIALMAGEAATPGVIALGIGGVVAFVAGALFLFEPGSFTGFAIAWPVIAGAAAVSVAFIVFVIGAALRARRRAVVGGAEDMINSLARVVDWQDHAGRVTLRGELWAARADWVLRPGDAVRVAARDGLKLVVEPDREGTKP